MTIFEALKTILGSNVSGVYTIDEVKAIMADQARCKNLSFEIAEKLTGVTDTAEYNEAKWHNKIYLLIKDAICNNRGEWKLPDNVAREVARCLLPNIIAYFETEEGKKEFAEWQKKKETERLAAESKSATNKKDGD